MLDFLGGIIAYPFRWIDNISPNYVVTLIIFAVFMKLLLFPFGIKQQKNSIKQAKLRPYENVIRKKYQGRTDKVSQQKMNEEIMQLYQDENFNPMSGCLPMLLQLPILFALYQVIIKPATFLLRFPKELLTELGEVAKLVDEAAVTEIIQINKLLNLPQDLGADVVTRVQELLGKSVTVKNELTTVGEAFSSLQSDFTVAGINLMDTPTFALNLLILVPILVFVFSWGSMKLTRKFTYQPQTGADNATAASMKMMDITMPLMSTFICFQVPAGIGIYWIIQNVLGVAQQYALYKMFPIPEITEEELREAEKRLKGRSKREEKEKRRAAIAEAAVVESTPVKKHGGNGRPVNKQTRPVLTEAAKARVKKMKTVPRAVRRLGK